MEHIEHSLVRRRKTVAMAACGLLAITAGCSSADTGPKQDSRPHSQKTTAQAKPLAKSTLQTLLLTADELGPRYTESPKEEDDSRFDDMGVEGCPALEGELGKKLDRLKFAAEASTSFSYGENSGLDEELYSDAPDALTTKMRTAQKAATVCPTYTMTSGSNPVTVKINKAAAPQLGDGQYAYTTTLELPTGPQIIKTVHVQQDNVSVVLAGAPALVDRHIKAAVRKASGTDSRQDG